MDEIKGTILAIDDDKDILGSFQLVLGNSGYEVLTTTSGREGERILADRQQANKPVDLVILDLMMPDLRGDQVLARLRANEMTSAIPVIMVSAMTEVEQRVELLKIGADDYLPKPFSSNELLARAAVHIQLGRMAQAKARAEAQIDQQERQLAAIRAIAQQATQKRDLASMLEEVVTAVAAQFLCSHLAIYLYEEGQARLATWDGTGATAPPAGWTSLAQEVIDTLQARYQSGALAVPIHLEDRALGALIWAYEETEEIAGSYERALEILANQMAVAINDIYLLEDLQRRNRQLEEMAAERTSLLKREKKQRWRAEQLQQMTQLISTSLELDAVLGTAMNSLREMLDVEFGSILLLDEKAGALTFAGLLQPEETPLKQVQIPAEQGIVGQVIKSGEAIVADDARAHPLFYSRIDRMGGRETRSLLCVPLLSRKRTLGAIELLNKRNGPFMEDDLALAVAAAGAIAVALDNAYLYREQRELVEELQLVQEQVVQNEKLAATGRLAASLAHEINNPLQAIHSSLQLATEFDLPPDKQTEFLRMANEEVERLAEIVTRILEFSRPSPGKPRPVSVNSLVRQVTGLAHKHLAHSNINLKQVLASDVPQIEVTPDQIAQVFLHVLLNAIDASEEGQKITIETRATPESIQVRFRDEGQGMTDEVQAHIFEPFFSTKPEASGLGLTISYGIIERHGGRIEVKSAPGKGSTFIVFLPRQDPASGNKDSGK